MGRFKAPEIQDLSAPIHAFWLKANKTARDRYTTLCRVYGRNPNLSYSYNLPPDSMYVSFYRYDGYPNINLFNNGGVSFGPGECDDFKMMLLRTWLDLEPV